MAFLIGVGVEYWAGALRVCPTVRLSDGLILSGSGFNLSRQTGSGSMIFLRPDPDPNPDTSVLKIFHLFYDDF